MRKSNEIQVWDPLVRMFHWILVAAFAAAYLTEDELMSVHTFAGYLIIGLLAFRLIWGFIGTPHARFSDFVYSPARVIDYLKAMVRGRPQHYLGHNPAGGVMILMLLASLIVTVATGLFALGAEGVTPVMALGAGTEELWEELHEFFANFTLFLVAIHVAGVIIGGWLHRENLVRAMITGRKPADGGETS